MTTDSVVIRRWQDLSELVERKFKDRWIYRGVPNHEHKLTPRIGRPGTRKNSADGLCLPYSPQEERRILSRFEREARAKFEWEPTLSSQMVNVETVTGRRVGVLQSRIEKLAGTVNILLWLAGAILLFVLFK